MAKGNGKGNGKKPGRPKIELDERQLEQLAQINCSLAEMATIMGCSSDTLTRNYAAVIEKGRANGKASLKRQQYAVAMGHPAVYDEHGNRLQEEVKPNPTMLIWLGKVVLKQVEASKLEVTGELEVRHEDVRAKLESRVAGIAARIGPEGVVRLVDDGGVA